MTADFSQRDYWDHAATSKTFAHPFDRALLATYVARGANIVDYGCGQGRLCGELHHAGYENVIGLDFSPGMIGQARAAWPGLRFEVLEASGPALPAGSADCVLLFAVLTCIPDDASQQALVGHVARLLKPGGIVYLSDYAIQGDARNTGRYAKHAAAGETFGVFVTDDGAKVRHHTLEWLDALFSGFRRLESRDVDVVTMNGHRSSGFQWILQKQG